MKLGAKRAELVQKFVTRSRIRIFHNERTRSSLLVPKLTFWCFQTIWLHPGPFGCLMKLGAKRAELVQKFVHDVASEFFATNTSGPPHWTLNRCFGVFHTSWVHLGPFGFLTNLGAKRAELAQKFVPRSRVGIFRNERTGSIPVDPKLLFWCVLFYLGALRTAWLPYETRCKTGRTSAKVRATKLCRNFSQQTHPIHPIGP